ncbi:uncharacterized protein LOC119655409 [Hermetia illucens]|uniref:uncharacterized protein LOC119655409 n=1 Tax=Hermetia illucens TaxID=343691 RepID=UPI0018CC6033|nr:uncharacterized protein LOC119655409 [Hermetia illucens]XP_037917221.1 uncharacterized protein LOC119655409 [Hermetia illucens]
MSGGMTRRCSKDCLGLRLRVNGLHQTWKWLHQTIALHEYLISMSAANSDSFSQTPQRSCCH